MAALYTSTQLHMQLVLPHAADICAYRTRRPSAPFPCPNSCVLDQPLASMLEDLACSKAGLQQDCNFSAGSCDVACPAEAWAAQAALSLSQQAAAVVAPSNRTLAVLPWQAAIGVVLLQLWAGFGPSQQAAAEVASSGGAPAALPGQVAIGGSGQLLLLLLLQGLLHPQRAYLKPLLAKDAGLAQALALAVSPHLPSSVCALTMRGIAQATAGPEWPGQWQRTGSFEPGPLPGLSMG